MSDTADDIASQLKTIVDSTTAPWPKFTDSAQAAVFQNIQDGLAEDANSYSLWGDLQVIDLARIEAIQNRYYAAHPSMSAADKTAWETVMATIDDIFASKDELFDFFTALEAVLNDRVNWTGLKVTSISALVSLNQSAIFPLGDSDTTVWSIILAPLQAIPAVGGTINTIANGVVKLAIGEGTLTVNPALAAIQSTAGQLSGQLADKLQTIVQQFAAYRKAACSDYGKLNAMHKLLIKSDADTWDSGDFSDDALHQAEIELWKPILAAGWGIRTPPCLGGSLNTYVRDYQYSDFLNLNSNNAVNFLYDQISDRQHFHNMVDYYYYTARYRVIGNGGGDLLSDDAVKQLFGTLGVPRTDVFNGNNGWKLPTGVDPGDVMHFPYFHQVD